jgi:hypothetical protein
MSFLHKLSFRFIFVYSIQYILYTFVRFETNLGFTQFHKFLWPAWRNIVTTLNDNLFHIRTTLIEPNGSTDTSFSWATLCAMLSISLVITVVWSIVDSKHPSYFIAEYWLRVAVRYFIAYFAFYYGIIKLFAVQMPAPSLSQLSTPLGDLSPTRLAWMFVGYSTSYQIFSGVMETLAGVFLLFRRTTTLGLLLSLAVFGNVVALNFSYDIPVKLMSIHFVLYSAYLLLFGYQRIIDFFFSNKPIPAATSYSMQLDNKWMRYGRIVVKCAFIYVSIIAVVVFAIRLYKSQHLVVNTKPIEQGMYDVKYFSINGDSGIADSIRWQDMALYGVIGSIKTSDTMFIQRYKRGYFSFEIDTTSKLLKIKRDYNDSSYLMSLRYEIPQGSVLRLAGLIRKDSLKVELIKRKDDYRLSKPNQFHWLQEVPQ